jgi:NADH-quinone oxidoreductase subunit C
MDIAQLLAKLHADYADSIEQPEMGLDMPSGWVEVSRIDAVCRLLKEDPDLRFDFLTDLCGVDHHPATPRFEVVYHLHSLSLRYRLRLKCRVEIDQEVPTVTSVWRTANWHERETYDMYGIRFHGHPDLRRIYLWDEFDGFPLRKDYPLRGYQDDYNPFGDPPATS